jgi:triosephosphate isomerase
MSRRKLIAGNWKMNKTPKEAARFFESFQNVANVDVAFAAPFTSLVAVTDICLQRGLVPLSQNVHWADSGAFTGEISWPMLNDIGVAGAIIGHSERRQYFGETNASCAKRVEATFRAGKLALYCIGETKSERESGATFAVLRSQLREGLTSSVAVAEQLVIAYEPVWAIGTGLSATSAQAEEAHNFIREELRSIVGVAQADALRILYGGSVTPANAREILNQPNIDGALVGGASLKPDDFIKIIQGAM